MIEKEWKALIAEAQEEARCVAESIIKRMDDGEDKERWMDAVNPKHPSYSPGAINTLIRIQSAMSEDKVFLPAENT